MTTILKKSLLILSIVFNPITIHLPIVFGSYRSLDSIKKLQIQFKALENKDIQHIFDLDSSNLPFYDPWGRPFDLQTFTGSSYVIRSFGSDNAEATALRENDILKAKLEFHDSKSNIPYRYLGSQTTGGFYFPIPLLEESRSPKGNWLARRYQKHDDPYGSLMVRSLNKARKSHLFFAPHSHIREFLWLANSKSIVYITENPTSHSQRAYVWNIYSNDIILLNHELIKTHREMNAATVDLGISRISTRGEIDLIVIPKEVRTFDFTDLQYGKFRYRFKWDKKLNKFTSHKLPSHKFISANPLLFKSFYPDRLRHRTWGQFLKLPTKGTLSNVIADWQSFTLGLNNPLTLSYVVPILARLIRDAAQISRAPNPKQAMKLNQLAYQILESSNQNPYTPRLLARLMRGSISSASQKPFFSLNYEKLPD